MESPATTTEVGWYKNGALPGNQGNAVIAGHVDGPRGEPAVFFDLQKLQIKDTVTVIDSVGRSTMFRVRDVHTYTSAQQAKEVFATDTGAHLNLITCTGGWDTRAREFDQRLVVFTDRVE
jgi:sortase (surface protein transpeptidase)